MNALLMKSLGGTDNINPVVAESTHERVGIVARHDAILAVWGHLNSAGAKDDVALALRAAVRMQESLRRLNGEWQRRAVGMAALQEFRRAGITRSRRRHRLARRKAIHRSHAHAPQRMELRRIHDVVRTDA